MNKITDKHLEIITKFLKLKEIQKSSFTSPNEDIGNQYTLDLFLDKRIDSIYEAEDYLKKEGLLEYLGKIERIGDPMVLFLSNGSIRKCYIGDKNGKMKYKDKNIFNVEFNGDAFSEKGNSRLVAYLYALKK